MQDETRKEREEFEEEKLRFKEEVRNQLEAEYAQK